MTEAGCTVQVAVPDGVLPGDTFAVAYGGITFDVCCPEDVRPGEPLDVLVPAAEEEEEEIGEETDDERRKRLLAEVESGNMLSAEGICLRLPLLRPRRTAPVASEPL